MISSSRITVLLGIIGFYLPVADSSPYVISDDRVRNLDVTPALGRGYSIMTNTFQSTCLMVQKTTVPSYNYKYEYFDFTDSNDVFGEIEEKMSGSFSLGFVGASYSRQSKETSRVRKKLNLMVTRMRLDRYYSSVREEITKLDEDALHLIEKEDYVGFFKACGANYIRGIRRAQEVTATLTFRSTSTETASEYSETVKKSFMGNSKSKTDTRKEKFFSMNQSLNIEIEAYGLGLTVLGSDTLIAVDVEQYLQVMKYAFRAMTQHKDSYHIGQVYGMEVVPWVDNTAFQVAAKLIADNILLPQPRSLIQRSFTIDGNSTQVFNNTDAVRAMFRCKNTAFSIDKYGYCCEVDSLYDFNNFEYDPSNVTERICRPVRPLDKALVKDNLATNGEFVARLDRAIRYRINNLATLERCISDVGAIEERYHHNILRTQSLVEDDLTLAPTFTVRNLQIAIDPFKDYTVLKHVANQLDEYTVMYYARCLNALYGTNIGNYPDVEVTYFMAYPWYTHKECRHMLCLDVNSRWDRKKGGCVPSIFSGGTATYDDTDDDHCAYDEEKGGPVETCRHTTAKMKDIENRTVTCWKNTLNSQNIDYIIGQYCMPIISDEKVSSEIEADLEERYAKYCDSTSNV